MGISLTLFRLLCTGRSYRWCVLKCVSTQSVKSLHYIEKSLIFLGCCLLVVLVDFCVRTHVVLSPYLMWTSVVSGPWAYYVFVAFKCLIPFVDQDIGHDMNLYPL